MQCDIQLVSKNNCYHAICFSFAQRIPITSVEITTQSGDVITLSHTTDNYWTGNSNGGEFVGPLNVKMTAANGEILYDVVPRVGKALLLSK